MSKKLDIQPGDFNDLTKQIADAVAAGFTAGAKESKKSFGNDLVSEMKKDMDELKQKEKDLAIEKKIGNLVLNKGLSTRQAEIVVARDAKIAENNLIIAAQERNMLALSLKKIQANNDGNDYEYALLQKEIDGIQRKIEAREGENKKITGLSSNLIKLVQAKEEEEKLDAKKKAVKDNIEEANKRLKAQRGIVGEIIDQFKTPEMAKAVFAEQMASKIHKAHAAFEEFHKAGLSAGQAIEAQFKSFSILSLMGLADNKGVMEGVIEQYGNVNALSSETVDNLGHMAHEFGITGQEALKLNATLSQMPGETSDTAANAMRHVGEMAKLQGIAPGKIMKDMASNTAAMALFGSKGAEAFGKSVIALHKMGVEIGTAASMAKGLLNFEDSINAQMEASVLLGKEINLDKAREMALNHDIEGATREILRNVGGQENFNKMNVLQQEALAKASGMTVEQLQKAMDAQKESNKYSGEASGGFADTLGQVMALGGGIGKLTKDYGMMALSLFQVIGQMKMMRVLEGQPAKKGGFLGKITGGLFGKKMEAPPPPPIPKTDALADSGKKMSGGGMMSGFKKNMKALASGFKEMGQPGVLAGVRNTFIAGPALVVAVLAIPFISFMGKADLKKLDKNFTSLATGLIAMAPTMMGSVALTVFGVAAIPALASLPFLYLFGKMDLKKLDKNFTSLATGLLIMAPTMMGSVALLIFAAAGASAIPSLIFLAGIASIGKGAEIGLKALGKGLAAFGSPATALFVLIGIGLIGALGLAMIPFAYAISLLTPVLEVLGKVIIGVFSAIPPIITAIADGFVKMFGAVSQDIGSFLLLGPALMMTGMGLVSMAAGGLMAMPIIGMLIALATVAPALIGLGAALGGIFDGGGGGKKEDKMDTLIAKIDTLIGVASKGGVINMDGKKVGEVVRQGLNTTGIR